MSVAPLAANALVLPRDAGLAGKLALGQVIEGRVLRQFEGSRYLVRFLGEERVVESAVELRPGEVLRGRVVALEERIELQRVGRGETAEAAPDADALDELFRRHRATLDASEAEVLRRLARRAARPERMALAGLVLRKLSLPMEAGLLQSLYALLEGAGGALAPLPQDGAPDAPAWWPAGQRVLNAQSGSSVSHRLGLLPVAVGEGALDVEAAMFEEQPRREGAAAAIRHRKIVLGLEAPRLGRIELRAVAADRNLRVAVAAESAASTGALAREAQALSHRLEEDGWQVDEIRHETRSPCAAGAAALAAAEQLVTPGSVSRLL